ncbi:MAG: hypothetical protein AABX52_00340, partial [Nanoarchaeota archaeon]
MEQTNTINYRSRSGGVLQWVLGLGVAAALAAGAYYAKQNYKPSAQYANSGLEIVLGDTQNTSQTRALRISSPFSIGDRTIIAGGDITNLRKIGPYQTMPYTSLSTSSTADNKIGQDVIITDGNITGGVIIYSADGSRHTTTTPGNNVYNLTCSCHKEKHSWHCPNNGKNVKHDPGITSCEN